MGVLYGYFAAADDDDAVRAVVRDDGETSGTGYDQLVVKGMDPVVNLAPAEALLTGRSDAQSGALVGMLGDGEVVVVTVADAFRDALAAADPASFSEIATAWSNDEDAFLDPVDPDDLHDFLDELSGLAARAVDHRARLYCWICP
ncbi:hypothetical protein BZB76_0985 [Actinomadura pelletieri DSM 43383]|uniref:DUF1877 family protein n=1 Tax=Actinomadura pelletieri DSM 43383 TaxID=1120940 RepID=A0A495QZY0_9ACTN|nr:hypothetical protein [Actinomadura pelletieri]RKS79514.1 hypothetical protein BZB76_0985 [Actinomadura pelletieri DSM 43383]